MINTTCALWPRCCRRNVREPDSRHTDRLPARIGAYQNTAPYEALHTTSGCNGRRPTMKRCLQPCNRHVGGSLGLHVRRPRPPADHALATLGKTPREVGYEHRIGTTDALGGFGTVALDHYAHAKLGARERQHIVNSERVNDSEHIAGCRAGFQKACPRMINTTCGSGPVAVGGMYANLTAVTPIDYLHELDAYQNTAPYEHDQRVQWPTTDNETLLAAVQQAWPTTRWRRWGPGIYYEQASAAIADSDQCARPLRPRQAGRAGATTHRESERVNVLNTLLGSRLTESQLARVESNWYTHNAPDDVVVRIVAVMTDPSTWLDLLVKTGHRETDGDTPSPKGGW